jgi:phosphopentomutase
MAFDRVILIVLDSVGIGEMPDAAAFGDAGSDTLGHVCSHRPLRIPNLESLGLGCIRLLANIQAVAEPLASFGKMALASNGKDTTTGHWELAGIVLEKAFPTYPAGFPTEVIEAFEAAIGRKTLGNCPASGTEIIQRLGAEHVRTGFPIVYTSADSVFQIAAHEEVISVAQLYDLCRTARSMLRGPHEVGRVIARPFIGQGCNFQRTPRRQDFAIQPPPDMLLDQVKDAGLECVSVGKIASIYCDRGITRSFKTSGNADGISKTLDLLQEDFRGLLFINLVDFDMLYGHRNDVEGYAQALEAFDACIPELKSRLKPRDLCILTADHGCDPVTPSTDHSREYVPLLAFGSAVAKAMDLGTRASLADAGQTVAENFGLGLRQGKSFLRELLQ